MTEANLIKVTGKEYRKFKMDNWVRVSRLKQKVSFTTNLVISTLNDFSDGVEYPDSAVMKVTANKAEDNYEYFIREKEYKEMIQDLNVLAAAKCL